MGLKTGITLEPASKKRFDAKIASLLAIDKQIPRILKSESKKAVAKMKVDAPVDTGRLKTKIEVTNSSKSAEFESKAIDPNTNADYAPFQEFGTRFFGAQPYFFKNIRKFNTNLKKALIGAINKITNK